MCASCLKVSLSDLQNTQNRCKAKPNPLNQGALKLVHFSSGIFLSKEVGFNILFTCIIVIMHRLPLKLKSGEGKILSKLCCGKGYNILVISNSFNVKSIDLYKMKLFATKITNALRNSFSVLRVIRAFRVITCSV